MAEKTLADVIGGASEGGFLGFPERAYADTGGARVAILGAATATPYARAGAYCAEGPAALRKASKAAAPTTANMDFDLGGPLLPEGVRAVDCGDAPIDSAPASPDAAAANRATLSRIVRSLASQRTIPVVLGGDDSIPIPVALGLEESPGPLAILQIDAHIDWRPDVAGETMGLSSTMRRISEMPHVGRIVQVGRRGAGSATAGDVEDALARGVHFEDARALSSDAIERAAAALPEGGPVLICFDADALDPSIMPAVIGRLPGGLSYWQALALIEACARRGPIAGFCFTEFMPPADVQGLGANTAVRVLANAIGRIARQPSAPR